MTTPSQIYKLAPNAIELLRSIGSTISKLGGDAYLTGGAVRDVYLDRVPNDLDIVVSVDLPILKEVLDKNWQEYFGTFQKPIRILLFDNLIRLYFEHDIIPNSARVDLISNTIEFLGSKLIDDSYPKGSIKSVLSRYDFTINACAFSLEPEHFGEFISPFDSLGDLIQGIIRPSNPKIFLVNPICIARAAVFSVRYGFTLSIGCTEQMTAAAKELKITEELAPSLWYGFNKLFASSSVTDIVPILISHNCLSAFLGFESPISKTHITRLTYLYKIFEALELPLLGASGMSPYGIAALFSLDEEHLFEQLLKNYFLVEAEIRSLKLIRQALIKKNIFN